MARLQTSGRRIAEKSPTRCPWARTPVLVAYHDREWGVPVHDDRGLFEFLTLEGAQAGLSWETVLRKRARYQRLFRGFDPERVARITPRRLETILRDRGIIRNRAKIESAIGNARALRAVRAAFGTFDAYLWQFVGGRPLVNHWRRLQEIPDSTEQSEAMSRDLRQRGFRFVGPTICYAFMQAVGMVNDHLVDCAWHDRVGR
jgi:DNA-3-methyladenine glycosylase I